MDAEGGGEDVVEEGGDTQGGREDEVLGVRFGVGLGREGVHARVELSAVRRDVGRRRRRTSGLQIGEVHGTGVCTGDLSHFNGGLAGRIQKLQIGAGITSAILTVGGRETERDGLAELSFGNGAIDLARRRLNEPDKSPKIFGRAKWRLWIYPRARQLDGSDASPGWGARI